MASGKISLLKTQARGDDRIVISHHHIPRCRDAPYYVDHKRTQLSVGWPKGAMEDDARQ